MIEEIVEAIWWFLNKFIAEPKFTGIPWSLEHMIRCECTHFCLSFFLGYVAVYLLILTTYSPDNSTKLDHFTYLYYVLFGVCISVSVHIVIDAFTTLA